MILIYPFIMITTLFTQISLRIILTLINSLSTFDRYNNVEMINIPGNTIRTEAETVNITVNVKVHRLETKSQVNNVCRSDE